MKNLQKGFVNIIAALIVGALAVCVGAGISHILAPLQNTQAPQVRVGAINYPTGGGTYRLASSISSTQTTITLSSFKEPVSGITYTMSYLNSSLEYGTVDPQTTNSEFVSFTGITANSNGTVTLTGVSRGLSRSYPFTASSTFQVTHSGQSVFILSNPPQLYNDIYTYINNLSIAGSVDATAAIKGIVQLATGAQAANHSAIGSGGTTAALALGTQIASSTRTANTAQVVVASSTDGYIDSSYINTSTLTGFSTTTKVGGFPAYQIGMSRQVFAAFGTSTFTVPSGITKVHLQMVGGGGGGGGSNSASISAGGGGAGAYFDGFVDLTGTSSVIVFIGGTGAGGASTNTGSTGTWSTFGANGFYATALPGIGGTGSGTKTGGAGGATSTPSSSSVSGYFGVPGGAGMDGPSATAFSVPSGLFALGGSSFFGNNGASSALGVVYGSGGTGGVNQTGNAGSGGFLMLTW